MMTQFIVHAPSLYFPSYALSAPRYQLIHNLDHGRLNPVAMHYDFPEVRAAQSPENRNHPFTAAHERYKAPPEFELYDLEEDPYFLNNLADEPEYEHILEAMRERLLQWRIETADPLLDPAYRDYLKERYRDATRYVPVSR